MHNKRGYRLAAVWLALGCGLGAVLLLRPPCPVYRLTGWQCAACGGTRMLTLMLHGQWAEAFAQNPYLFCVLPLWACCAVWESLRYLRGKPPVSARLPGKLFWAVTLAAGLVFCVLRNL